MAALLLGLVATLPATASAQGVTVSARLTQPETFPVLANQLAAEGTNPKRGMVRWDLAATGEAPVQVTVKSLVQGGFTDVAVDTVTVRPGRPVKLYQNPTLRQRMYRIGELTPATAYFAAWVNGRRIFERTQSLSIRPRNDVVWGPRPGDFRWARFIVAWVTPHDSLVQQLMGRAAPIARRLVSASGRPGVTLASYHQQGHTPKEVETNVRLIARAVYETVRRYGMGYVSSIVTYGDRRTFHQRVRFPRESLLQRSANCIDFVVLYASLFENIGLEPVIALMPGHALVGVRLRPGGPALYIETTLTPSAGYDEAVQQGTQRALRARARRELRVLDVKTLRQRRVLPFPAT